MRRLLLITGIFLLALLASSCAPDTGAVDLSGQWEVASPGGWRSTVTIPARFPLDSIGEHTVSKVIDLPDDVRRRETSWIYLGHIDFPFELRVNGNLVLSRGGFPPASTYAQSSFPAMVAVPRTLWERPDGRVEISLRTWFGAGDIRWPSRVLVGDDRLARFQELVKYLNADFFLMFFGINLTAALYFFAVWMGRRSDMPKLWFALSSLFMSTYFFELGSPLALFEFQYRALGKASLSLSVLFVAIFFIAFFKIHNRRPVHLTIAAAFGLAALYVASSPNDTAIVDRFNVALIPLELLILFILYLLVRALRARHPEAPVLAAGIALAIGFGTHDVVFQVSGGFPVLWLQGIGFFALQCSMFLSLAMQGNRLYATLEDYSKELLVQKDELARTNQAFARFVPREFLSFLGKESIVDVKLGDQVQKDMTILFSDIREFTALSEKLSPHQNFNLLNSYLSQMAPTVRQHGGIIDKYIGDAIMALYSQGAADAVASALSMRDTLHEYNEGRSRAGYTPLEMGIGIHSGSLMLGTIGDDQRMESTVISDAVNTASRIEGLTKVFGVPIIISETVLAELDGRRDDIKLRYLGRLPVRGRSQGLGMYELVHAKDPLCEPKLRLRGRFEDCVRAWETDRAQADRLFADYRELFPTDPALGFFMGAARV